MGTYEHKRSLVMPSLMIHIAIGQEYLKKHNINDKEAFLHGCIAPDFAEDTSKSHYSAPGKHDTYKNGLQVKTMLDKVCKNIDLSTDYNKGVFLHLLTDNIFYLAYKNSYQVCKLFHHLIKTTMIL